MPRISDDDIKKRYSQMKTNLEWLRIHSGKTLVQIGEYVGLCDKVIGKRFKNPETLTLGNIDRLARLFNVAPDKIVYGRVEFIGNKEA